MTILSAVASCEVSLFIHPGFVFIQTNDTLAEVLVEGYLNGQILTPCGFLTSPSFNTGQVAVVTTTDFGTVKLIVNISGGNTSLIPNTALPITAFSTSPANSQSSSLTIGTAYQNNLGYDVMLTVYLNITSAINASILLGVGSTSNPAQQTILSGLNLAVLGIVPVNIYLPDGYYAKLSTSGTIVLSIFGQLAMPI